jgi:NMT1/THI5 like
MEKLKSLGIAALVLALVVPALPAQAGQSVSLILNWTPAADHSPFYYAKALGLYAKAGIDLSIEVGKGSGVSSLKGLPTGADLYRHGKAVPGAERLYRPSARSFRQDGREQGAEVRTRRRAEAAAFARG